MVGAFRGSKRAVGIGWRVVRPYEGGYPHPRDKSVGADVATSPKEGLWMNAFPLVQGAVGVHVGQVREIQRWFAVCVRPAVRRVPTAVIDVRRQTAG